MICIKRVPRCIKNVQSRSCVILPRSTGSNNFQILRKIVSAISTLKYFCRWLSLLNFNQFCCDSFWYWYDKATLKCTLTKTRVLTMLPWLDPDPGSFSCLWFQRFPTMLFRFFPTSSCILSSPARAWEFKQDLIKPQQFYNNPALLCLVWVIMVQVKESD